MANKCFDCKYYNEINEKQGKCKFAHPERHLAYTGDMNKVKVDNGWPVVNREEKECGDFRVKP